MNNSIFSILVAPPAFGKTHIIKQFMSKNDYLFIYVSPLRALAKEVHNDLQGDFDILYLKSLKDSSIFFEKIKSLNIIITTVEVFSESYFCKLKNINKRIIFILDEIHLFFTWGQDFRPNLIEFLYNLGSYNYNILGLTATLDHNDEKMWFNSFKLNHYICHKIDLGNFTWNNGPFIQYCYNQQSVLYTRFCFEVLIKNRSCILFCNNRKRVKKWENYLITNGINTISCISGEVDKFIDNLKLQNSGQIVIISTSCLGHGVNLPIFDHVFIDHYLMNKAFWLQMGARGGRRGEKFILHSMNNYDKNKMWKYLFNLLKMRVINFYINWNYYFGNDF